MFDRTTKILQFSFNQKINKVAKKIDKDPS